jgi:hypothetical protein
MAIKINKALSASNGMTVPSGSVVKFITEFPMSVGTANIACRVYQNEQAFTDAKQPIETIELKKFELTSIDLSTLTTEQQQTFSDAVELIHVLLKAQIDDELQLGAGESEIV